MSRSLSHLRRGFLGIAFAGSLGFGATQVFAGPLPEARRACSSYAEVQWCRNHCASMGMLSSCDAVDGCTCISKYN